MRRRVFLTGPVVGLGLATTSPPGAASPGGGGLRVARTSVEHAETLLGTDVARPRLSWVLTAGGHGARQTAYEVEVGTTPGRADVWSSGRVDSDRSVGVEYAGPALRPRTRYHWRVRVRDASGAPSPWSASSWWETALLGGPWTASWIGAGDSLPGFGAARWIWTDTAPVAPRWFRGAVELPADVARARLVATADDDFTLYVAGQQVLHVPEETDAWKTGRRADVTGLVRGGGRVVVAARATNRGADSPDNPAGLLVRLLVEHADGSTRELVTGPGWKVATTEQAGWQTPEFDDSGWVAAPPSHPYGQGPWGSSVSLGEAPAPLLRKEFTLTKPVVRARLHISGLAYYEAEINGRRVGDSVLDPGFTDYDDTVLYAVHDVTGHLREGANAIGATLGRGFYGMRSPNVWRWERPPWHAEPKLLAQLEVDHPDGTRTVVASDGTWRVADGPTLVNSLYTGETYDARRATPGWSSPGLDDSAWRPAAEQDAPRGVLRAQQHEPIRVVETVTPVAVTEPRPGVFVADMGRTMAGWTRLEVTAPEGTVVGLLHGEKLNPDGTVHMRNEHVSGSRVQYDEYICAGGQETWEPRFSYKGFRYVQVTGLSSAPGLAGRVVHSDVREASRFSCSVAMFEQLDRAMRRTVVNNLHGIPTDTPTYEKNGWTGDAQVGVPSMTHEFDLARFFTKWLGDLADSVDAAGQVPVIVPSGGWGYRELAPAPEWTTVYPYLVREMHRVYGDTRVVRQHWSSLVRYLDWELGRLRDGLAVTALGDYLAPGTGGNPPEDTRLTATAYLYRALLHTAELGELIGQPEVAARYREAAGGLRDALNATFLDPAGYYRTAKDPGYRQTSNAVPLAFGMVPAGSVAAVADRLAAEVRAAGDHLDTGCLGTSVLLPVLTEHGHADVAHALATQRTYPSWGYWLDSGADTMWEMWDAETRSRNHYFKGTVVQWLYENVAGLRPGEDGFRTFVVRPDARVGVSWVRYRLSTVRGEIEVGWSAVDGGLRMTVDVPVGSTAEVHVPGTAATADPPVAPVRTDRGWLVFRVDHGRWNFHSP
ncbi:family 78 glycoside hydrolase catalytic domain [Saccharothrix coeruleofusca]|uniref:alpha-L-rhamnosidase n=1 Tax=Saccharothrix coeruleofusca TaxID=33919 RepID=A0A918EEG4_9PSEU|nr:family 78 glycoside hydrolase catalytic domain [Saccharothrix coeruleofusca]GGP52469.1 hydrolase [Saccharothrix coeruleofusca]